MSMVMPSRSPWMMIGSVDQRLTRAVEIPHEGFHPALIVQFLFADFRGALVAQDDPDAGIQEGQFAQAVLEG